MPAERRLHRLGRLTGHGGAWRRRRRRDRTTGPRPRVGRHGSPVCGSASAPRCWRPPARWSARRRARRSRRRPRARSARPGPPPRSSTTMCRTHITPRSAGDASYRAWASAAAIRPRAAPAAWKSSTRSETSSGQLTLPARASEVCDRLPIGVGDLLAVGGEVLLARASPGRARRARCARCRRPRSRWRRPPRSRCPRSWRRAPSACPRTGPARSRCRRPRRRHRSRRTSQQPASADGGDARAATARARRITRPKLPARLTADRRQFGESAR